MEPVGDRRDDADHSDPNPRHDPTAMELAGERRDDRNELARTGNSGQMPGWSLPVSGGTTRVPGR